MSRNADSPRLARAELLADVTDFLSASGRGERGLRLGLEAELIPVLADDGGRVPLDASEPGDPDMRSLLAGVAESHGWVLEGGSGIPRARIPDVGVLTFEPGGQVEIATRPFASVDGLVSAVHTALAGLMDQATGRGIRLLSRGMDPSGDVSGAPMVVRTARYRKQRDHYDSLGPWGARMMVLSAALHVNVDLGGRAVRRWWVANRMASMLTALFANAPHVGDGDEPPVRSWRAEQWRRLDPTRTGVFGEEGDPAGAYLGFALGALDFLGAEQGAPARPFRSSWEEGADREAWHGHLSTLFPEVRPRGYLELRSIDALRPAWYAVPLVLAAGILYDPAALAEAQDLIPPADPDLLLRAGRAGMGDAEIAKHASAFFDLALHGAENLGAATVGERSLEVTREYRDRFVALGEDPGYEADGLDPFQL